MNFPDSRLARHGSILVILILKFFSIIDINIIR